jgi:hypothetical protein
VITDIRRDPIKDAGMRTVPLAVLASLSLSIAVVACGSDSGSTVDGAPGGSGSGSGSGSGGTMTLTLSGTAQDITTQGRSPLANVMITAYKASDDSVLGMATSAADGTFSISVTTTTAIDGYLKATYGTSGYQTTYLYPPHPLTADYANVPVFMISTSTWGLANTLLGNGQNASSHKGWIALIVQDAAAAAVPGAVVTSTPMGQVNYNSTGANPLPSTSATSTGSDGIAYDTNIAPGTVTVSATKTGATFLSHDIKVRQDVVTLTLITE